MILTLYPLSAVFAVANLFVVGVTSTGAARWYWGGLACSALHFALYAKRAVALLDKVRSEEGGKEERMRSLKEWLELNFWRGVGVDALAWVCFGVAAGWTFQGV